jgi:Dual specificity phosphatase, catalytic domain
MSNWFDAVPMTQVDHRLWVGGYIQAAMLAAENPKGITAVLNVSTEPPYEQNPQVIYRHIPFHDGQEIPRRQFAECLGWLKFMYEAGHVILIHCAAGISRSPTITASFMDYIGIADFDTAMDRIRMARPIASPAPAVLVSAKQMLGVWPYDGSMGQMPEHERTMHEVIEQVMSKRAANAHPDENCPMKQFLLTQEVEDNRPRHLIQCTCEKLLDPMEVARLEDGKIQF